LFILNYILIILELTLSVCVWRWSCDLSHRSRWYSRWWCWCV